MEYLQLHSGIIDDLRSMGIQEHSKYSLVQILKQQNPDLRSEHYLVSFHKELISKLDHHNLFWISRTHHRGLTYMCNEHKAFIFLDINKNYIALAFFTGNQQIEGLIKGNWSLKFDNMGCKRFRVFNDLTLQLAVKYALESYKIAKDWEGLK